MRGVRRRRNLDGGREFALSRLSLSVDKQAAGRWRRLFDRSTV
jgi:hypothetical protein